MFRSPVSRLAPPPWLAHALRAQRGPVPWSAVTRGALAAGPLLLAGMLGGRTPAGTIAAIAAMLAGINDRPGSRRACVERLGTPALAGALGLLVGTYAGQGLAAVPLTVALTALGLVAGGVSAVGPVASAAGTQFLVAAALGAGMPAAESGWQRALAFLAGAGWLILLRLALPTPGSLTGDFRFDGERTAVADVYDAIAALLDAVGGAYATDRRAALTAALDHAQDALAGPRLRRYASSAAERRLHARYTAALPLAEAATALYWAGEPVAARAAEGPRRLAAAVRDDTAAGPLPAPHLRGPRLPSYVESPPTTRHLPHPRLPPRTRTASLAPTARPPPRPCGPWTTLCCVRPRPSTGPRVCISGCSPGAGVCRVRRGPFSARVGVSTGCA